MIFWKKNTWKKLAVGDLFDTGKEVSKIIGLNPMYGQIKLENGIELKFDSIHSYSYRTDLAHCNITQWKYAFIDGCLYTFGEREKLEIGSIVTAHHEDESNQETLSFEVKGFTHGDSFISEINGKEVTLTVSYGYLLTLYDDDLPSYICSDLEVGVTGMVQRIRDERNRKN
ncbi:hypothetical protein ZPAH1_orf00386 [Aeromonas phage ZPAH1]|nr:hypothetical protein ZPAH1_orf00386 [Aeromonas phage ZPAH1]